MRSWMLRWQKTSEPARASSAPPEPSSVPMPRSFLALGASLRGTGAGNSDTPLIPVEAVREQFRPAPTAPSAGPSPALSAETTPAAVRSASADTVRGGPATPGAWSHYSPAVLLNQPRRAEDSSAGSGAVLSTRRGRYPVKSSRVASSGSPEDSTMMERFPGVVAARVEPAVDPLVEFSPAMLDPCYPNAGVLD